MLLKLETLRGIRDGSINLAFRRWRRPTVKAGGTLLTPIGQLAIEAVERVDLDAITEADAAAAGFSDLESLLSRLSEHAERPLYRVRLSLVGPDPRIALREEIPGTEEMDALVGRLEGLNGRSGTGPWTHDSLRIIAEKPGVRAGDLAPECGMEKDAFKARVRKLKALGLTESLGVGYRLSPRGEAVLNRLDESLE